MTTSVGTKARKKQSSLLEDASVPISDKPLQRSLVSLENACMTILDIGFAADRRDTELLTWQHRFKNIVTPVSLALAEYKGPRCFHYHYRHSEDDDSVLQPVQPAPLELLAQVCKDTLRASRSDLVGIDDRRILDARNMLDRALSGFLMAYKDWKRAV